MKFFLPVRALGLLTSLVVAQQGCNSVSATDAETIPLEVTALAPTVVDGVVGQIAPFSPRVRVVDATTKQPIANLPVSFSGGVSVPVARTDANGIADAGVWKFSERAGTDKVYVSAGVVNVPSTQYVSETIRPLLLTFFANLTHDAPSQISADPAEIVTLPGRRVTGFNFVVADKYQNPIAGIPVTFSISRGELPKRQEITGQSGATTGPWEVNAEPGSYELTASVDGLQPKVAGITLVDSALFRWYRLVAIRTQLGPASLQSKDLADARFGLTDFTDCPCSSRQGLYASEKTFLRSNDKLVIGGHYDLALSGFKLSTWPSAATMKGDSLFVTFNLAIVPGLMAAIPETWVYKPDPR